MRKSLQRPTRPASRWSSLACAISGTKPYPDSSPESKRPACGAFCVSGFHFGGGIGRAQQKQEADNEKGDEGHHADARRTGGRGNERDGKRGEKGRGAARQGI